MKSAYWRQAGRRVPWVFKVTKGERAVSGLRDERTFGLGVERFAGGDAGRVAPPGGGLDRERGMELIYFLAGWGAVAGSGGCTGVALPRTTVV